MTGQLYPCLWFDGQAKAAAEFYCSLFNNSTLKTGPPSKEFLSQFPEKFENARITSNTPMVVTWVINGQKFMGLNGGPNFKFNEAVSFVIECDTQEEIDYYWNNLTSGGGEESMCGWCKDRFGVSWQIVPKVLGKLMADPVKGQRVIAAFMKMRKFDIATLLNA